MPAFRRLRVTVQPKGCPAIPGAGDHARMTAAGVRLLEEPRHEAYGSVAVFEDLYGNRWDLLQPAAP